MLLMGCTKVVPVSVYPVFPSDIDDCSYPVLTTTSDTALAQGYIEALGQIKLCNGKLKSVRDMKEQNEKTPH